MILNVSTPSFSRRMLPHPSSFALLKLSETCSNSNNTATNAPHPLLFFTASSSLPKPSRFLNAKASISESQNETSSSSDSDRLDQQLLLRVASTAKDADEALQIIADNSSRNAGVVSTSDSCSIISDSLNRNNPQLALSVFYAMRSTFHQVGDRWKWSKPNASVYTVLIKGLAASLRVSDALSVVKYICEVGVSPGEEVPFGKIVRCPTCRIAVAVAQPQQGIQSFLEMYEEDINISAADSIVCQVSLQIRTCFGEHNQHSIRRDQHGRYSMGKGVKVPETDEAKHSFCSSLYCGADPFWYGSHTQVCN